MVRMKTVNGGFGVDGKEDSPYHYHGRRRSLNHSIDDGCIDNGSVGEDSIANGGIDRESEEFLVYTVFRDPNRADKAQKASMGMTEKNSKAGKQIVASPSRRLASFLGRFKPSDRGSGGDESRKDRSRRSSRPSSDSSPPQCKSNYGKVFPEASPGGLSRFINSLKLNSPRGIDHTHPTTDKMKGYTSDNLHCRKSLTYGTPVRTATTLQGYYSFSSFSSRNSSKSLVSLPEDMEMELERSKKSSAKLSLRLPFLSPKPKSNTFEKHRNGCQSSRRSEGFDRFDCQGHLISSLDMGPHCSQSAKPRSTDAVKSPIGHLRHPSHAPVRSAGTGVGVSGLKMGQMVDQRDLCEAITWLNGRYLMKESIEVDEKEIQSGLEDILFNGRRVRTLNPHGVAVHRRCDAKEESYESDSSSDLFELDNLATVSVGIGLCRKDLPVYELKSGTEDSHAMRGQQ